MKVFGLIIPAIIFFAHPGELLVIFITPIPPSSAIVIFWLTPPPPFPFAIVR